MAQLFFATVFRHRGALILMLGVPIVVFAMRGEGLTLWSALVGVAIAAAGVVLRLSAVRWIGRGARVFRPHAGAGLIVGGPYRWSRNPLYLAAALMLGGLGLIAGASWVAVALFPATLLAYMPVVLAEERALAELLGQTYTEYLARVPRWLGVPCSQPETPKGLRVEWSEVFRREKALVPGVSAGFVAIAALRERWLPTHTDRLELALDLKLVWLVSAAAALAVLVNAFKVERDQRLRRARRAARALPPKH